MPVELIAKSEAMRRTLRLAQLYAPSDLPILLTGETGTGKTTLAQWIHEHSPRASEPFEVRNCGAFSETLVLSELFGHEPGAFTGANQRRDGAFRTADNGTLFLDEISRIAPSVQGAILKAIDEKIVQPLGCDQTLRVNVRLITATNLNLWVMPDDRRLADDLLYRLSVLPLHVPSLRDRPDDLLPLARQFLRACRRDDREFSLAPEAVEALRIYPFGGNIRELHAVLEECRLLAGSEADPGGRDPAVLSGALVRDVLERRSQGRGMAAGPSTLAEQQVRLRREEVARALSRHQGNVTKAAKDLGCTRPTLYRWMREMEL